MLLMAFSGSLVLAGDALEGRSWTPPSEAERCPSKWGPDDERGSANHMKPETVLRAAKLIRTGEVIELGHVLNGAIPVYGNRRFDVHLKRTFMNPQPNRRGSNEELVVGEIGQLGSQVDALSHQTIGDSTYNCFNVDAIATRSGFTKLGVEKIGTLMTRGVLIDVAALKATDMLPDAYEITPQDLQDALKRQSVALQPGDAVLIHTGRGRLWARDNGRYMKTTPGIGVAAADWLIRQDPMLIGSDNFSIEVIPNPDGNANQPVHQILVVGHGILLAESLRLDELAAKGAHEFAFILQPLKIQGGTGSTVAPVAVR